MQALGMIETRGMTALVEAVDAMVKTAEVQFIGYQQVGGGLVVAIVRGDVASCQAAVEAGSAAAQKIGELVSAHVIPRPASDLEDVFPIKAKGKGK
ncbi:MAG: ethanolamine utilization microcompartment protein EutM [bacterium]